MRFKFFNFFSKIIDSDLFSFESANFKTHGLNDFVDSTYPELCLSIRPSKSLV